MFHAKYKLLYRGEKKTCIYAKLFSVCLIWIIRVVKEDECEFKNILFLLFIEAITKNKCLKKEISNIYKKYA